MVQQLALGIMAPCAPVAPGQATEEMNKSAMTEVELLYAGPWDGDLGSEENSVKCTSLNLKICSDKIFRLKVLDTVQLKLDGAWCTSGTGPMRHCGST